MSSQCTGINCRCSRRRILAGTRLFGFPFAAPQNMQPVAPSRTRDGRRPTETKAIFRFSCKSRLYRETGMRDLEDAARDILFRDRADYFYLNGGRSGPCTDRKQSASAYRPVNSVRFVREICRGILYCARLNKTVGESFRTVMRCRPEKRIQSVTT